MISPLYIPLVFRHRMYMSDGDSHIKAPTRPLPYEDRRAAALRENLKRRKDQQKAKQEKGHDHGEKQPEER